jgi:protein pelota
MKILKKKLKPKETETGERKRRVGELALVPESLDDLWHLKHVIEPGDLVYSLTYRRIEEATDKVRPDKADKKPVRLGIRTDAVEFHKFSRRLRIKGVIEEGPETELGAYHTFNIEPDTKLSVVKAWKEHQLKRLREAEKAFATIAVLVVTVEEGEAVAGIVRQYGVDELFSLRYSSGKGMEHAGGGSSKSVFFGELLKQLQNSMQTTKAEALIIAGPGFIKDDFFSFLKDHDMELAKKTRIEQASSIGVSGFLEVLKRGAVERLKHEERLTKEVTLLDRLMAEISKDEGGKAVYGKDEVRKALEYGAVETLMVSDEKLMRTRMGEEGTEQEKEAEEIDRMLEEAERKRGEVVIFSTEFEPGKRLNALGGIAALLRFAI